MAFGMYYGRCCSARSDLRASKVLQEDVAVLEVEGAVEVGAAEVTVVVEEEQGAGVVCEKKIVSSFMILTS